MADLTPAAPDDVLIRHLPSVRRVVCKATASTLRSRLVWLQRYVQNLLCKVTLHDFTIAFQHFTARTSLRPQGVRGRRNAQVRGRLFGHALLTRPPQSWPNSPLVAAQRSALLLAAISVIGELPVRDAHSLY